MKRNKKQKGYPWKFSSVGGSVRVTITSGEDIAHLGELDRKLWTVLSCPTKGLEFDQKTLAHIDSDGHGGKPFELPCANPDYHRQLLKSYNVPEFMRGPVTISPQRFADALKQEAEPVKYVSRLGQ